jgi:hypothetical protein
MPLPEAQEVYHFPDGRTRLVSVRVAEWIVVAYFASLAGAALARRLPPARRLRVVSQAAGAIAVVTWISRYDCGIGAAARNWLPALYLLAMYWVPAALVTSPNVMLERWLRAGDDRYWRGLAGGLRERISPLGREILELTYLFCYALIPIGLATLAVIGAEDAADRYWTAVLLAGALSYGPLPWLATYPPRVTGGPAGREDGYIRMVNLHVLGRASVQWNTFPSGHVATAMAAALAVSASAPRAGAALLIVAVGIALAAIAGRYHYVADVAAASVVALLAFAVSRL